MIFDSALGVISQTGTVNSLHNNSDGYYEVYQKSLCNDFKLRKL